jgi:hypothetical protein
MTQNSPPHWYYRIDIDGGHSPQLNGPFSDQEVVEGVRQGKISPTTELCSPRKTGGYWLPAGRIGFLLNVYQSRSNPPPLEPSRKASGEAPSLDRATLASTSRA